MFVKICRLPDRVNGAAGCHGDGAHHVRGTGPADPPLPGKDPTHCKLQSLSVNRPVQSLLSQKFVYSVCACRVLTENGTRTDFLFSSPCLLWNTSTRTWSFGAFSFQLTPEQMWCYNMKSTSLHLIRKICQEVIRFYNDLVGLNHMCSALFFHINSYNGYFFIIFD